MALTRRSSWFAWKPAAITAVLGLSGILSAQSETKLIAADPATNDQFGTAAALSGDTLAVGVRFDDDLGPSSGSVQIFERSGGFWQLTAVLTALDGAADDRFGSSVALQGDRLVVGALRDDDRGSDSGSAYVFERGVAGWSQVAKLTALDGSASAQLGVAVALDGDRILTGAFGDFGQTGATYVFDRDPSGRWIEAQKLLSSDRANGDMFGDSVALSGDVAFIGAPGEDGPGDRSGAGYVFELQSGIWTETTKLKPADLGLSDNFASDVVMTADRIVAGAREHANVGAVYVFERGSGDWSTSYKLFASDGLGGDLFGSSVALDGDRILVGAQRADSGTGSAYRFAFDPGLAMWTETQKLTASDRAIGDTFGQDVVLRGRLAIVCAVRDDNDRGAVYVYEDPSPVDPVLSTVEADDARMSAFGGATAIRVTPRDSSGRLLGAGFSVQLQTTAGTLVGSVIEQGGVYSQDLQGASSGGLAAVSAIVDGVPLAGVATVVIVPVDLTLSEVAVSPESITLGEQAMATVTPRDDQGALVGPGLSVAVATTVGTLNGAVLDNGDGTYSQLIDGSAVGTAEITATVEGLALEASATLSIENPATFATVVGVRVDGTVIPYASIQKAVWRASEDRVVRILVPPGDYNEFVRIRCRHDLAIEGLTSFGPVTVRGFRVTQSHNVTITNFEIRGGKRPGVFLTGWWWGNRQIVLQNLVIHGAQARRSGIVIATGNADVTIDSCLVELCGGHGIRMKGKSGPHVIMRSTIQSNGRNGIHVGRNVEVRIADNVIRDNGTAEMDRRGYGILRQRACRRGSAQPEAITLINNALSGNRGRVINGKSDHELGNYDQMIDPTDRQPGYGGY